MTYVAGLDIGSKTTKLVILKEGELFGSHVIPTGSNVLNTIKQILDFGLYNKGLRQKDIEFFVSTGYGRHMVDFSKKKLSEITCQAKGVRWIFPSVDTIIDIGGQDYKIIKLNGDGKVIDFAMNDKCAAGTGRYLEVMANIFSMNLDDFSKSAKNEKSTVEITSVCTVFAETEVVNLISKGYSEEKIIAGIFKSVSRRVYSLAKRFIENSKSIVFTGGGAKNSGLSNTGLS